MCMWVVGVGLLWVVPSFASWSTILLTKILMFALTLNNVMLCLICRIWWILHEISSLLGWLF